MANKEADPAELSRQLQKPTGEFGKKVALEMNRTNRSLYELGWSMIDFTSISQMLEIGFGNGKHFAWYFEQNPDLKVAGVDFSEDMCEMAGAFNGQAVDDQRLSINCAPADQLPVGDHRYDLVLSFNTIYFHTPPETILEEIRRVLKPGGTLLIGFRPPSTFQNLPFPKDNFTLYEPDQLKTLLELNGFQVERVERNEFEVKLDESDEQSIQITDICTMAKSLSDEKE